MRVINAGIEHSDDHLIAALRLLPGLNGADVRFGFSAALARVFQRPLVCELRVVRQIVREGFAELRKRAPVQNC